MEYAEGGELFNYILEKKYLSEDESRIIFQQIIDAVYYLHQIGVCHRDLKLENILFSSKNKDKIKIIDFGLSNLYLTGVVSDNPALAFGADFLETPCGSPSYTPPEMILGCKYDGLLSDIWSCGIILFSMLCGFLPFDEPNEEKLYAKIIKGEFFFPPQINISDEAKCLIQKILVVNPRLRANIKDIRRDPWFLKDYKPIFGLYISIRDIPVSDKIIEEMENYNFNKKTIIENVKRNRHNKVTTFYYLLVNKYLNEGKETESDLISNIFNEYLREQDLKNKLIKKGEKPISLKIMKYNSKPLFDLKEEDNNDNSNQKFDLEYLKSLLEENILNISEQNKINKKEENNKEKILDKEGSKNNIEKNHINNINVLKNKIDNKKDKKDSIKKINKNIHNENKLNEKSKNNSNIFEFKNKYSNLTSINKRKKIISESEEKLSKDKKKEKKIIKDNANENKGSDDNKRIVSIKEKDKEKKKGKSKMNNQKEKNSNLKLNDFYFRSKKNKIYVDTKSISNNIVNSSINLDTLNSINNNNNMNVKINKIKKLKDQNLKNSKSKNKDKEFRIGSYFEYCKRGIIPSRNYFKLDLNNELKTSRQYRSRFVLQSSSNSKSKSKSLRSKSIYTAEKINGKKIFYYNISKNKIKNKIKNYFNVKISNMKPSLLTEGSIYNHSENKLYSSSKDNKINKAKSNSILKSKYSKNKIDNKKFIKLNKNIDNIPLKIQKTDSVQKRNNDNKIKNFKTIKKLELNKIINNKNKSKQGIDCHLERININSNFKTIKYIGNQLTERNNIHINNIINNKKYGFLENNFNNKKTKNSSSSLQKTIPSLKGAASIDNKSTIKKGLINSIYDYNSQNNPDFNNNKRKSKNNILKNMNKNKLIRKMETNNENKNKNNTNWNKNKVNILSNNNIMISKIRKISPINKKKQFIKTSISSDINITDSNKELSDLNKLVNNKINAIKIKEIKSIKISNIQKNDIKSRTSRRSNNFRNINDYNNKVKFGDELGNISYKKVCTEKNGKNIKISNSKRLNINNKNINKIN